MHYFSLFHCFRLRFLALRRRFFHVAAILPRLLRLILSRLLLIVVVILEYGPLNLKF